MIGESSDTSPDEDEEQCSFSSSLSVILSYSHALLTINLFFLNMEWSFRQLHGKNYKLQLMSNAILANTHKT